MFLAVCLAALGAVIGFISKLIPRAGGEPAGCIASVLIGVVASLTGGLVATYGLHWQWLSAVALGSETAVVSLWVARKLSA